MCVSTCIYVGVSVSVSNPTCCGRATGTLHPESCREIIGTFSQVITIQRELGSKPGRPGSRGARATPPSVIFSDKVLSLPASPQGSGRPIPYT